MIPFSAHKIEQRAVADLIPYARNSRTHSAAQVSQLAKAIQEFGFTNPVLIGEDGGIIAGHGRVLAARKLKMATVPTIAIAGWSDDQKRAYVIWDNKSALMAGWDDEALRLEVEALLAANYDVDLTGFDEAEIAALLASAPTEGLTDPDEVIAPPLTPTAVLGDLWRLGGHVLVCGDATNPQMVARALDGAKPHLMVTDPPYGVDYDADWRNRADRANGKPYGARAIGLVMNDSKADWRDAWALFPGEISYVWHAGRHASVVQQSLEAVGFEIRCQLIWAKQQFAIGRGHYHWQHEPCWYAVRKGASGHWNGGRKQTTLWEIPKPVKSETGHSTQKPVECMKRPIENNSVAGQHIYEPFSGSGTTIIACEMTSRHCHALELSPAYVDVAIMRWEAVTGQQAVHETGKTFAEMKGVARPAPKTRPRRAQ